MTIVTTIKEMQAISERLRQEEKTIGVVPTMGYLHEGHLSLVRIAKQKSDIVIMTIFVNPAQFGPKEDFTKYPRAIEQDQRLAVSAGADYLFMPEAEEMYSSPYFTFVDVTKVTDVLEGAIRPGHFRGVATVVAKLFNITKPHCAVFGQKDAQQIIVIRKMVKDLNFDIELITAPIIREPDGLAMSSRNVYLSAVERQDALILSRSLKLIEHRIGQGEYDCTILRAEMKKEISTVSSAVVDYVSIADTDTLEELSRLAQGRSALISLAVRIGTTRLIDNTIINIS